MTEGTRNIDLPDYAIALILLYYLLIKKYIELEFKQDVEIDRNENTTFYEDLYLYDLFDYRQREPGGYNSKFSEIETKLKQNYQFDDLDIPETLGQLAKLTPKLNKYIKGYDKDWISKINDSFKDKIKEEFLKRLRKIFSTNFIIIADPNELSINSDDRSEFSECEALILRHFSSKFSLLNNFNSIKNNWDAVVLVIHKDSLKASPLGGYFVTADSLSNVVKKRCSIKLCMHERFAKQHTPKRARGTGFFIGPNLIATAAHLFRFTDDCEHDSLEEYRFLVNVTSTSDVNLLGNILINEEDIYMPVKTQKFGYTCADTVGEDWAIIEVKPLVDSGKKNSVICIKLITNSPQEILPKSIYCIGHPIGMPKKIAFDGKVTNNFSDTDFFCSLDLFGGNSGSPVFDAETHKAIGVAVGLGVSRLEDCSEELIPSEIMHEKCLIYKTVIVGNKYSGTRINRLNWLK